MRTFAFLCLCVFVAAQAIGQTRTVSISVLVKDSRTDGVVKGAVVKVLSDGEVLGASVTSPMGEAYFTVPISITSVRESEAFCPGSFILSSPYPNPSDGPVSMGLQIPVSGSLDILVYNVLGEVVYEKRFHTPPGGYILSIDLKGLADGLYLVQARSERETKVRKFLKIGNAKSGFSVQPSCMMVPSGERGIVHVAKRVRTSDVLEFVAYTDVESRVKVDGTWSDEVAGFARDTVEVRSDTTVVLYLEERPAAIYGNYKAPKAEVPPVVDGDPDDACWELAPWAPIDQLWLGTRPSPDDFSGRYKIVWTPEALHYLVEIVDDSLSDVYSDPLKNYWKDDCLELFIDEDRSGGDHTYNFNAFAYHIALDYHVVDLTPSRRPALFDDHITVRRRDFGRTSYWEVDVKIYDDSFHLGGQNEPVVLHAYKRLGYAVAYCDADGTGERESFMGSIFISGEDKNVAWRDASVFGTLELLR